MKKQNGFSQIVVMVIMLILAIALPVTANLVKKVQDNRSSAAEPTISCTLGDSDIISGSGKKSCGTDNDIYVCRNVNFSGKWVLDKKCSSGERCSNGECVKYTPISECTPGTGTGQCNSSTHFCARSGDCAEKFVNGRSCEGNHECKSGKCETVTANNTVVSRTCVALTSTSTGTGCSSTNCSACGTDYTCATSSCDWNGTSCSTRKTQPSGTGSGAEKCVAKSGACQTNNGSMPTVGSNCTVSGATGKYESNLCTGQYNSGYRCCVPSGSSAPAPGCGAVRNQCDGNNLKHCDGTNWSLVTACPAGCDGGNNTCKDECTIGQTPTCSNSTTRQFCNKDADGGIRLKTQTCSNGCEGGNCKATPAPVGCGTSGTRRCDGKGTLQICNGTDWISQPVAAICEGTKAYNCDGNITVTNYFDCATSGQVCVNGHCVNPPTPTPVVIKLDPVCTSGAKSCFGNNAQVCKTDGSGWTTTDCGALGCNATTKVCNVCTSGAKKCSNDDAQVCKTDGSGWTTTDCGALGCNTNTKVCNICTTGSQKCTAINKYFTCSTNGVWSTTTTNCSGSQVCTNGEIGTAVCRDPAYTAPKLNLYFAISGVKKLDSCFGNLNFNVSVTKDGSNIVTSREVTATIVDNKFNDKLGDQVFEISNFDLTNDYALTDKIKITIGSSRKTLTTIYGKDSQNSGFPALNKSQILVSSLVNNVLSLYNYPVLNGDIGTQGSLGTQDRVVNGADYAFMKNEWGKTCKSGENLNADLNGDCRVDTFDLQILKNAMAEQYSQKTD